MPRKKRGKIQDERQSGGREGNRGGKQGRQSGTRGGPRPANFGRGEPGENRGGKSR